MFYGSGASRTASERGTSTMATQTQETALTTLPGPAGGAQIIPISRGGAALSLLPDRDEWQTMCHMAGELFKSGLLPDHIKNPQMAVAIIQKGRELQLAPMFALCNLYVIGGKPAANAEIIAALIYRDHGDNALVIDRTDDQECIIRYRRRSWPAGEYRTHAFTMIDAGLAGLPAKDMWKKWPANMLRARCISAIGHMAYQDSLGGIYTPEEMGAVVDGSGTVIRMPDPAPGSTAPRTTGAREDVQEAAFRPTEPRRTRNAPKASPTPAEAPKNGTRTVDRETLIQTLVTRQGMLSSLGIAVPELEEPDRLTTAQLVETCKGYRTSILEEYRAVYGQAKEEAERGTEGLGMTSWTAAELARMEVEPIFEETLRVGLLLDEIRSNAAATTTEANPLAVDQL